MAPAATIHLSQVDEQTVSSLPLHMRWECRPFDELTLGQLYAILELRSEVFVWEQDCAFQDVDGLDPKCIHVLGLDGDRLLAYARVLPDGLLRTDAVSVGRIVTSRHARRRGLGAEALAQALAYLKSVGNTLPIVLESQHRLEDFYKRFGFESVGEPYLRDGQSHIIMVLDPAVAAS